MHDLKINLTSPTNAWHDSEDLQFKWLKNQNESWVWTILLVDSFFTDFLCRMYILWWQCLLRLYIQYQFFSSCMFDLMNVILDFWYNSHMEQKIFKDSCESRIKRDSYDFKSRNWQLRSIVDTYESYISGVTRPGVVGIYLKCHYMGILPICSVWSKNQFNFIKQMLYKRQKLILKLDFTFIPRIWWVRSVCDIFVVCVNSHGYVDYIWAHHNFGILPVCTIWK